MSANTFRKMTNSDVSADSGPILRARAIVAGHAMFADGLISAVDQIAGAGHLFKSVTNTGLSGPACEVNFRTVAVDAGIKIFFTDLPGGSATLAVRRMMREDPSIVLVTGTNLATLLEFAFHSEEDPVEAVRLAAEKGRAAIVSHGGG
jgi:PTS system N-acetylgalactosamine-specific IIA component